LACEIKLEVENVPYQSEDVDRDQEETDLIEKHKGINKGKERSCQKSHFTYQDAGEADGVTREDFGPRVQDGNEGGEGDGVPVVEEVVRPHWWQANVRKGNRLKVRWNISNINL